MLRTCLRGLCLLIGVGATFALSDIECATAPEPGDLRAAGKVEFAVSCAPDVQSDFARGVALLHSFFYEEARRVFTSVAERDPNCAMAQWGIAMSWWHPIWTPPTRDEMSAGKAAMRQLRDKCPEDFEVQTFYACAVLGVGYATPTDSSLAKQLEAAAIFEKLWKQNPNHPGVVHYLIHCYDYPALAQRGLAAARAYDSIAPWVPHALHMPSHIF